MKRCSRCGETKALEEFGIYRAARDGRYCYCRPCERAYRNARSRGETPPPSHPLPPEERAAIIARTNQERADADWAEHREWKRNGWGIQPGLWRTRT